MPLAERMREVLRGARRMHVGVAYAKTSGVSNLLRFSPPAGSRAVVGLRFECGLTEPHHRGLYRRRDTLDGKPLSAVTALGRGPGGVDPRRLREAWWRARGRGADAAHGEQSRALPQGPRDPIAVGCDADERLGGRVAGRMMFLRRVVPGRCLVSSVATTTDADIIGRVDTRKLLC